MDVEDRQPGDRKSVYETGQSQLCAFCQNLLGLKLTFYTHGRVPKLGFCGVEDRDVYDDRPYRPLEEYQQAVLEGCHLCFIFWSYTLESTKARAREAEVVTYNVYGCDTPDETTPNIHAIQLTFKLREGGSDSIRAQSALVSLVPTAAIQSSVTAISPDIEKSSESKRTLDMAKLWLKECSDKHVVCKRLAASDDFLPTRLLDIKHYENDPISLCLSQSLKSHTKYMTLSHCWGGKVPLTLTSATLVNFCQEIPFNKLPKTFQEAIKITRQLGIQYLWIDSLCIMQDSREDWKREAAMMGEVYRHSWCNIAATKAKDGLEGCFDNRDPRLVAPCRVTTTWPGRPQSTYYCMSDDIWTTQIDNSPLSSRGWVLQEIMLSPRVLHYAKGQVFWECPELRACESHPGSSGITLNEGTKINMDPDTIHKQHERLFKYTPPSHDKYYVWDNAIHEYSKRDLTFPQKDIFLAISGIARLLIPEKEYVAGLWNSPETIIEQLLWYTQLDFSAERSPVFRAPSWSWASLDSNGLNHVGYESRVGTESMTTAGNNLSNTHALIKVLQAETTLEDSGDAYGAITNGHINLKGAIVSSAINFKGFSSTAMCLFGTDIAMHLNHDFDDLHNGSKVYCLPLRLDTSEEHYERGSIDYLHGLLLEPTNLRENEYYRRGYFLVENEDPSVDYEEDQYSANILRFWNILLQGSRSAGTDHPGETDDLIPEDLEAHWTDIRLI